MWVVRLYFTFPKESVGVFPDGFPRFEGIYSFGCGCRGLDWLAITLFHPSLITLEKLFNWPGFRRFGFAVFIARWRMCMTHESWNLTVNLSLRGTTTNRGMSTLYNDIVKQQQETKTPVCRTKQPPNHYLKMITLNLNELSRNKQDGDENVDEILQSLRNQHVTGLLSVELQGTDYL